MTREQERLYKRFVLLNKSAHSAGEPYLMEPERELKRYCECIPDDKAKEFLTAFKSGILQAEQKAADSIADDSDAVAVTPLEMYLWQLYMMCGGNTTTESGGTWVLFYSILRELIEQDAPFLQIAQSKAMNALPALFKESFLQPDIFGNMEAIVKMGRSKKDSVRFIISEYSTLPKGLTTTTKMLLDFFLRQYIQQHHNQTIMISLQDYARFRGRSTQRDSLKALRDEVVQDLKVLANIQYQCLEKLGGKWVDSGLVRINGGTAVCAKGIITWNFNTSILPALDSMAPLDCAEETFKQDPRTSGYYISRYIDLNYRMNGDRTITIQKLLEQAPTLPKIEEVKQKRMSAVQKIIKPFFVTLDKLERIYYDIIGPDGTIIQDPESMTYDTFINSTLKIDYSDYPVHPRRIAAQKARQKAKRKKAAGKEASAPANEN